MMASSTTQLIICKILPTEIMKLGMKVAEQIILESTAKTPTTNVPSVKGMGIILFDKLL